MRQHVVRKMLTDVSEKSAPSNQNVKSCKIYKLAKIRYFFWIGLLFNLEDVGSMLLRNVSEFLSDYMKSYRKRYHSARWVSVWRFERKIFTKYGPKLNVQMARN
jgi:hypothetical protein